MKQQGRVTFDVFVKGSAGDQTSFPLTVNVMTLDQAFEVGAEEFEPDSNNVSIYIKNLANFNFDNIDATFKSPIL